MRRAVVALTVLCAIWIPALAGSQGTSTKPTAVSVGERSGSPDTRVNLPVTLSAPDEARVGTINIRLGFPKALVKFIKIEASGVAEGAGAQVHGEVKEGSTPEESVLHASIATSAKAGARRPLPLGRVAEIVFDVDKSAQPGTWIPLTHEATALTTDDPARPITPVLAYKTRIGVALPVVTACFFYMH